ncbi:MAG: hypothetical protein FJ264_12030 [Planctomycetes bacterium]|nr:hypothetical protein [Planctomycetota bacterium]
MFVLKKLIAQLLFPVPLCFEVLIVGIVLMFFSRRQRLGKYIVLSGILLFVFFCYSYPVAKIFIKRLEYKYPPLLSTKSADETAWNITSGVKWIVILAGGHISDHEVPVTSRVSEETLVRLVEGIRLHRLFPESRIVLSGGRVFDPVSGAETMAELAMSLGVKKEDLVLQSESKDTHDEAKFVKPIIGNDTFILVTSANHMTRAMGMFEKSGMSPIPAPAGHTILKSQGTVPADFFPSSYGIDKAEQVFYEYLGILWALLRGQI